jgi:hypothetical protein
MTDIEIIRFEKELREQIAKEIEAIEITAMEDWSNCDPGYLIHFTLSQAAAIARGKVKE